jgi:hypothetical protein
VNLILDEATAPELTQAVLGRVALSMPTVVVCLNDGSRFTMKRPVVGRDPNGVFLATKSPQMLVYVDDTQWIEGYTGGNNGEATA